MFFKEQILQKEGAKWKTRRQDGTEYKMRRKNDVLNLTRYYINALSLPESLQEEMSKAFDLLFPLLPWGTKLHGLSHFAEIVVFHVLKENNLFNDPDKFVRVSPLGDMPMYSRYWLLRYRQYLPATGIIPPRASADVFLRLLYESPRITDEFREKCEEIKPFILKESVDTHPKTIAGMVCFIALKTMHLQDVTMQDALNVMGIGYAGSIHNALRRLKFQWKLD